MDLGLALPHYDHSVPGERPLRWETVVQWAQAAERAGLASVWLSDHLFVSLARWGGPAEEQEGFECLTTVAALARATTTVRLGTLVLCPHLRPPGVLAKALATVDVVSGGRLTVGLGAGWLEPGHAPMGLPVPTAGERLERLGETIEVLRLAFGGEPFDFEGSHLHLRGMVCRPRPLQRPGLPLWIGGRSDRLLELVARLGDGWNAGGWWGTVGEYRERLAVLERACIGIGRDPRTIARSVNRLALVGEDEADLRRRWERLVSVSLPGVLDKMTLDRFRRGRLVGTVGQVREQIGEWTETGVQSVIVSLGALPFTVTRLDDLEMVASTSQPH